MAKLQSVSRILADLRRRWSPRSFDASPVPQADLDILFEAAGLAPPSLNYQPWTFLYSLRQDANWQGFLSLLIPINQNWVRNAGSLIFVVTDERMRSEAGDEPSYSHNFDCRACWVLLTIQAIRLGYHAHAMTGVEFDIAWSELSIPEGFRPEVVIAGGCRAPAERLPDHLRDRERPSVCKPVGLIARAGNLGERICD